MSSHLISNKVFRICLARAPTLNAGDCVMVVLEIHQMSDNNLHLLFCPSRHFEKVKVPGPVRQRRNAKFN